MMRRHWYKLLAAVMILTALISCTKQDEMTLEEAQSLKAVNQQGLMAGTIKKPGGVEDFAIGKSGGTWYDTVTNDPKTFNMIAANSDGTATAILSSLSPGGFSDYDPYTRTWKPEIASHEIKVFKDENHLDVIFTLRDDLYWSFFNSDEKVKITSDDIIFWYNEIQGNPDFQMVEYNSHFMKMPDGTEKPITFEKIDDRRFIIHYPKIIADPLLSSNMTFGPKFIYEPVLREKGVEGVKNMLTIDTDVKKLPSGGRLFLTEYTPGVRLVYERNNDYWEKDKAGNQLPYFEKMIVKIIPDMNTDFLLFKNGETDTYSIRAEDLEELVSQENRDYTVYDGGPTLGSNFISFNQNPAGLPDYMLKWFSRKEFRQAMSCLTNRERMVKQIYRGLATPALHHFAVANPYYDESISNIYTYNPEKALDLLKSVGMERDSQGIMRDSDGRAVEFDIITNSDNNLRIDSATIFADECSKVGIKVNVKPLDFQKIIKMMTSSHDWNAILLSLGSNYWPSGGPNVWLSDGNLHLWNPLQKKPATQWEARLDTLYNKGVSTPDPKKAKVIWDEFQSILLDELPLFYLVHANTFLAVRNKWDNVYFDNLNGLQSRYLFLKDSE